LENDTRVIIGSEKKLSVSWRFSRYKKQ